VAVRETDLCFFCFMGTVRSWCCLFLGTRGDVYSGTARLWFADGEDGLQIWGVAVDILNEQ
jgi:hypothetical protein